MMDPRKLLSLPGVYSTFRRYVGRDSARLVYARDHLRAQPGDKVLDIGCGPGDILQFLPRGVRYTGYDLSQDYIDRARQRFSDRGDFFCCRVGDNPEFEPGSFDVAIAHGVLHHLNDKEAAALFQTARNALKAGGRLITFDGCFTDDQSRLSRFIVSRDRGQHVRERGAYEKLARAHFNDVRSVVRHDLIRIPYTHLIMECTA
jgi:cyclopropane fatty-acyl-phospholipid synthase-like methyltransferase